MLLDNNGERLLSQYCLLPLFSRATDMFFNHFLLFLTQKRYHGTNTVCLENVLIEWRKVLRSAVGMTHVLRPRLVMGYATEQKS